MKISVLQPRYPSDGDSEGAFERLLTMYKDAPPSDITVLPEFSNAPGIGDRAALAQFTARSTPRLLDAATHREGISFVCGAFDNRNSILALGGGKELFRYDKCHLTDAETDDLGLDDGYARSVKAFEYGGVRYCFLTCFDIYFPELLASIALQKPDVIILPTYQRRETAQAITLQCRFLAYTADAYVLRSSFSLGEGSSTGGNSLVATPEGEILENMGQRVGVLTLEIDPHQKRQLKNPGLYWTQHRRPDAYPNGNESRK